jgi:hypothetical protein
VSLKLSKAAETFWCCHLGGYVSIPIPTQISPGDVKFPPSSFQWFWCRASVARRLRQISLERAGFRAQRRDSAAAGLSKAIGTHESHEGGEAECCDEDRKQGDA